jgi:hypothetical protein
MNTNEKNEIQLLIAEELDRLITEALLGGVQPETTAIELISHLKNLSELRLSKLREQQSQAAGQNG